MLQSVPQLGNGAPRRIGSFKCPTYVIVQVTGAPTLYLSDDQNSLAQQSDNGAINGLQITAAMGIQAFWWWGDLYASGSAAMQALFLTMEGNFTSSGLHGDLKPYGVTPTVRSNQ